jgi:uncharacterized membrane protein YbhN (UPF0104 family)
VDSVSTVSERGAALPESGADRGVGTAAVIVGRGFRAFGAPAGQPRARRATDLLLLLASAALLALAIISYPPSGAERAFANAIARLPSWLEPVWGFLSDAVWLWAIALALIALVRRRFMVVGQAAAAVVLACPLALAVGRLAVGTWPSAESLFGGSGSAHFPYVRLAEAAAVIVTVLPHLTLPLQRFSRWVLALGGIGALGLAEVTPIGTVASFLVALVAASIVRLAMGTSVGRPGLGDVAAGLRELGVEAGGLTDAERQVAGVYHVAAADDEGRPLLIKVYGRDAYDTRLVATLWRRLWYRGEGTSVGVGRLEAGEHEAFVTLLARKAGLSTRDVVTAGATADDDAFVVLRGDVRPLAAGLVDGQLEGAWRGLALLDELKIAHRGLDPSTVVTVGGEVGFVDFGTATVAPDQEELIADRARLLMTTASVGGTEPAVQAAVGALGGEGVAGLLPYLQPAAFSSTLRRAVKEAGIDVDAFRAQAAAAVGVESPDLVRLRRVTAWSAIQAGLLLLATYAVITAAQNVDWAGVRDSLSEASWGAVAAGFLVAQLPRVSQSFSTLGSVPAPLPFGPVYALQLATSYMNLALPSSLARLAVNIRFFQRQGLSATIAVTSGVIDSFTSTVLQAVLLVLLLIFSESTVALDLPAPSGDTRRLAAIILLLLIASVLTLVVVSRVRRAIVDRVRQWWPEVREAIAGLRASNKLALLIGGNLATEILFAVALGLFAHALGYSLSLAELLVINMSVTLLASFIPVPGGIGVTEFGLSVGLTAAGLTPEAALGTVILYRISTFYLPPAWGFVALVWLQRHRYL